MIIRRNEQRQERRRGFTLMEILVVVAIIVVLAGTGGYFLIQSLADSKVDVARIHMQGTLEKAVKSYAVQHGAYPQNLRVLLVRSPIGKGPYLEDEKALFDPWGQEYQYKIEQGTDGRQVPVIWTNSGGPGGPVISNLGNSESVTGQ